MNRFVRSLTLFVLVLASAIASELKVGSLNCYLLFDPSIDHAGKVDDQNRMSKEQYRTKLQNLASLTKGYQVVALQETGGRPEITALAQTAGMSWVWTEGRDTATGEEVGLLYNLPNWKVSSKGRVGELDRVVSKHLLVLATHERERVYFLVVHLIRPIGAQAEKQAKQLAAIGAWMKGQLAREPGANVVIIGDTNNSDTKPGISLYGAGSEAGELNEFSPTHLSGKCFDRLVVDGSGKWTKVELRVPPYGKRPNDLLKRVWTDHYFVGATLSISDKP